jgi:hypothetical protein
MVSQLKFWLGLGRVFGATQGGLLSVIFVTWVIGALGQKGIATDNIIGGIIGALILVIFSSKAGIKMACSHPYIATVMLEVSCLISAVIMMSDVNPWIILVVECAVTMILGAGFFQTRKALLNRKVYGDALTQMTNQLDIISMICALCGSGLAMVVPATLDAMAISILIASSCLFPINLMQVRTLLAMPDLKMEKGE